MNMEGAAMLKGFLAVLVISAAAAQVYQGPVPGMYFVEVPGAEYEYGRLEEEDGSVVRTGDVFEVPDFQIMTTEVTRRMWETVMGAAGEDLMKSSAKYGAGDDLPICTVNMHDCDAFIDSLNGMDSIYVYSLPPDVCWKYAASSGAYSPYPWGEDSTGAILDRCWFLQNSGDTLHPVAQLLPNQLGLHDMLGNVCEWTIVRGGVEIEEPKSSETIIGQVIRGGSYCSSADRCRLDTWIRADSSTRYSDVGFRVVRMPREFFAEEAQIPYDLLLDSLLQDDRFAVYAEPMLSLGRISHDFDDDDIQQFGYDVKNGCEQDAAYLRIGFGKHFGRFGVFAYGEAGHIGPGALFDNHGPWILPEVLLRMNLLGGGIELRYWVLRARLGYGSYSGEAEIDEDTTGAVSTDSWRTDIEDGSGMNYAAGIMLPLTENWSVGFEWSQHFIDLRLGKSGTGVVPTDHRARQSEVRFFGNYQLPF
jgi:formylglycine-generating enzyme required for sulfatase activity